MEEASGGPRARIEALIGPTVEAMGYEVVRVQLIGKQRPTLQVMIERNDRRRLTVDDCAEVSRALSAVLDVEDPIGAAYTLEVSSPGVDRPLTRLADFSRFAGHLAKVEIGRPVDGRRRFSGRLAGVEGETVRLEVEGATVALPFADIQRAKLVLTDELLAAAGQADAPPNH
jgi:ribosome maturation factor RimP